MLPVMFIRSGPIGLLPEILIDKADFNADDVVRTPPYEPGDGADLRLFCFYLKPNFIEYPAIHTNYS